MCCMRLAANAGPKKVAKNRHLGTIAQICRAISSQLGHVSTIGEKNLLSSNISSRCPYNMVNCDWLRDATGLDCGAGCINFIFIAPDSQRDVLSVQVTEVSVHAV